MVIVIRIESEEINTRIEIAGIYRQFIGVEVVNHDDLLSDDAIDLDAADAGKVFEIDNIGNRIRIVADDCLSDFMESNATDLCG